jgi:threonine dehydrogenase-like Zn-dependent dehydrogenase
MADQKGYHDFNARPGRKKVTVIGAGNVGTTAGQEIARRRARRSI